MRQRNMRYQDRERGFSLLEVLIAMAVSTLVMFAIYTTFVSGAGTYAKGDVKADIHQNSRASMELMVREIRLAGFFPEDFTAFIAPVGPGPPIGGCPNPLPTPFVGIISATETPTMIQITMCGDIDGDNSSELVVYTWSGDTNGDNVVNLNENEIRRQVTDDTGLQPQEVIAFNISQFRLRFFDNSNPPVEIVPPIGPGGLPCADNVAPGCDIRRVRITMTGLEPVAQSAAQSAVIGGPSPSPFATRVRNYTLVTDFRPRNLGL